MEADKQAKLILKQNQKMEKEINELAQKQANILNSLRSRKTKHFFQGEKQHIKNNFVDEMLADLVKDQAEEIQGLKKELFKLRSDYNKKINENNELKVKLKSKMEYQERYNELREIEDEKNLIQLMQNQLQKLQRELQSQKERNLRDKLKYQNQQKEIIRSFNQAVGQLQQENVQKDEKLKDKQIVLFNMSKKMEQNKKQYDKLIKDHQQKLIKIFSLQRQSSWEEIFFRCKIIWKQNFSFNQSLKNLKREKAFRALKQKISEGIQTVQNSNKMATQQELIETIFFEFTQFYQIKENIMKINPQINKNYRELSKIIQWTNLNRNAKGQISLDLRKAIQGLGEGLQKKLKQSIGFREFMQIFLEDLCRSTDTQQSRKKLKEFNDEDERRIMKNLLEKIDKLNEQIKDAKELLERQTNVNASKSKEIKNLSEDIQILKRKISQNKDKLIQTDSDLLQKGKVIKSLKNEKDSLQKTLKKKQQDLETEKDIVRKVEIDKKQLQKKFDLMKKQKEKLQEEIKFNKSDISKFKQAFQLAQKKYKSVRRENDKFESSFSDQLSSLLKQKIIIRIDDYSPGLVTIKEQLSKSQSAPILSESQIYRSMEPYQKQFLSNTIYQTKHQKPTRSKTLYQLDDGRENLLDCLQIINSKANLLVLIRLKNDHLLGGFSYEPFCEKIHKCGTGCIFTITNEKRYTLKNKPEASILKYGTYFFTFGNSEIVIKPKGIVTSLIGTAQTYFDTGEDRVEKFFGEAVRETNYHIIEFHQLFFD